MFQPELLKTDHWKMERKTEDEKELYLYGTWRNSGRSDIDGAVLLPERAVFDDNRIRKFLQSAGNG